MKIVFMGTPDFAVSPLKALCEKHEVVAVYTQPPRPSGRGHHETKSPVHQFAEQKGIPVYCPVSLKPEEEKQKFADLKADVAVVAAYGLLLPKVCLNAFPFGCLNIHGSLLPRWRGAAPIQRSIMAGDKKTGVTLMQMDVGMDTGDMLMTKEIDITATTTSESLYADMSKLGADLVIEGLDLLVQGKLRPIKQPEEGVTHADKIKKEEGLIDWNQDAWQIDCIRRGLFPWPGSWFFYQNERIAVLDAEPVELSENVPVGTVCEGLVIACKTGGLRLKVLRRDGKKAVSADDFLRGFSLPVGTIL